VTSSSQNGNVGVGVVGLGMHGPLEGDIVLQACATNLSRIAASPPKLSTEK